MELCTEASINWVPTYINLRLLGAMKLQLSKNAKYPTPLLPMSEDIAEEGDLLAFIPQLRYQDYNLQDPKKYPQFQADQYMCIQPNLITQIENIVPQEWIEKLAPSGFLKLLRIPHFDRSPEVNGVLKLLLSCIHDGYLWLEVKIDLNIDVIHRFTGLSKVGNDPGTHFAGKKLDHKLAAKLNKELKLAKGTRAYDSADIQDHALWFTVQLLARPILRKCIPNEVTVGAIDLEVHAKEGKQYNWCLYLLNQFMDDYKATQESNQLFHYSQMLFLMVFVTWKGPSHTQFCTVRGECRGVRYANLWANPNPDKQCINNHVLLTYYQQLYAVVANRPRITKDLTDIYKK